MSLSLENSYRPPSATTGSGSNMSKSGQRPPRQQPGSACEECRRKRIRCDRATPQCLACANSGAKCVVRGICPPRGPKKGYLRALERQIEDLQARLNEQREEGLVATHAESILQQASNTDNEDGSSQGGNEVHPPPLSSPTDISSVFGDIQSWPIRMPEPPSILPLGPLESIETLQSNLSFPALDHQQAQAQATLGVEMHLTPMICTDLDQLYFDRVHAFAPILQKFRYLSWSRQVGKTRQRLCLQYAMWTLAAAFSSQFQLIRANLYKEARKFLQSLDTDSPDSPDIQTNPHCISIEQVQAWILLSLYELTSDTCNYQRGMVSAGRAFRLIQLTRLYEIDGQNHAETNSQGQGHGDWIDIESLRRTFWLAYIMDRFTSAIDGLPLTFNEQQIRTRLPAPDAHFMSGRPTTVHFLSEMVNGVSCERLNDDLSPFTESIIIATICGRTLEHKQRPPIVNWQQFNTHHPDRDPDSVYEFCRRHRSLTTLLAQHIKMLSMHVSSTSEHPDAIILFVTLTAYMTVFMLCEIIESQPLGTETQAAQATDALFMEHKQRSLDAVRELAVLTATLGQLNHFQTHPFTPIPLLLIARFCIAHIRVNDAYSILIPGITTALQGLANLNGLAKNCLQLLELENAEPGRSNKKIEGLDSFHRKMTVMSALDPCLAPATLSF